MRLRFAQSTRKHRIGRAHAMHVINSNDPLVSTNARGEQQYEWVGFDDRGLELEIVGAIVQDGTLLIFHVMPTHYRRKGKV